MADTNVLVRAVVSIPGPPNVICTLLRPLINILFLLVTYGYTIIKNKKRIPKEMTVITFTSPIWLLSRISAMEHEKGLDWKVQAATSLEGPGCFLLGRALYGEVVGKLVNAPPCFGVALMRNFGGPGHKTSSNN